MQTWKWVELLHMLEVTTTGNHVGSQALDRHRPVNVFLWQLFPDGLWCFTSMTPDADPEGTAWRASVGFEGRRSETEGIGNRVSP